MLPEAVLLEVIKLGAGFVLAFVIAYWAREDRKEHKQELIKIIEDQGKRNSELTSVLKETTAAVRDMQEMVRDLIQYNDIRDMVAGNPPPTRTRRQP